MSRRQAQHGRVAHAAGNAGEDGWQGDWSAAAGDHWRRFAGTDTSNRISLHASDTISVALRWERAWTAGSQDYGVSIFAADSASPLADTGTLVAVAGMQSA